MAIKTKPEQCTAEQREVHITIREDDYVSFEGSGAQLVDEGLIPDDFEWPFADEIVTWRAGGFHHAIERTRPPGKRGPWTTWDHWWLYVAPLEPNQRRIGQRIIDRLERELLTAKYCQCGLDFERQRRVLSATQDDSFQSALGKLMLAMVCRH